MITQLHKSQDYIVTQEGKWIHIRTVSKFNPEIAFATIDEWNQAVNEAEPHSGYSKEDLAANHLWLTL